jgi:D-alanyl-D-alanine carboxypeptidase
MRSRNTFPLLGGAVALVVLSSLQAAPGARAHLGARPKPKPVLQRVVDRLVRDGAPGALVVLRTPTGIRRAASGLAELSPRVKLRATDDFRIASLTKSFVAAVVLELVGEGKLQLDDTVERWLPGVVPNGSAITIRELLNHTSGLYNYSDDAGFRSTLASDPMHNWTPGELIAIGTSQPPYFPPGTAWLYSNTNYILLGLIVEKVTGSTVAQQLRDRLFQPLGLPSTLLGTTVQIDGSYAHGYVGAATLPLGGKLLDISSLMSPSWMWAAGAIVSNGDDVTRFYTALLGGKLLPPNLLAAMRTVYDGSGYGLGIARSATACGTAYGHTGDAIGWRTIAYARSDGKRAAVVMVNIDSTEVDWGELATAAARALCSG